MTLLCNFSSKSTRFSGLSIQVQWESIDRSLDFDWNTKHSCVVNLINMIFFAWFTVVHTARDAIESRRPLPCCLSSIGHRKQWASCLSYQGIHQRDRSAENQSRRAILPTRVGQVGFQWLGKCLLYRAHKNLRFFIFDGYEWQKSLPNILMIDHGNKHVNNFHCSCNFFVILSRVPADSMFPHYFLVKWARERDTEFRNKTTFEKKAWKSIGIDNS